MNELKSEKLKEHFENSTTPFHDIVNDTTLSVGELDEAQAYAYRKYGKGIIRLAAEGF